MFILPALISTLILHAVAVLVMQKRWLDRLRSRHRSEWERLGRPSLICSIEVQLGLVRFIRNDECMALGDAELSRLGRRVVLHGFAYAALFLLIVAYGFCCGNIV